MNSKTLTKLNSLAATKGLKVEAFSYCYQLKSDIEQLITPNKTFSSKSAKIVATVIRNLIKTNHGWEIKKFTHVWKTQDIYTNDEGFIQGQINGEWVDYNYTHCTLNSIKPTCFNEIPNILYLGYLDFHSEINYNNYRVNKK